MKICANCRCDLPWTKTIGISSLYFPNGFDIELCEPCFFEEDAFIEKEGGNNQPERLAKYFDNIGKPYLAEVTRAEGSKL